MTLEQDGICDKNSAPSVSSISRVLRGGSTDLNGSDGGRSNHSIDGILGRRDHFFSIDVVEMNARCANF